MNEPAGESDDLDLPDSHGARADLIEADSEPFSDSAGTSMTAKVG